MEIIEVQIPLEDLINREYPTLRDGVNTSILVDENGCPINPEDVNVDGFVNQNPNYGQIDKSFIYIPIFLTQTYDNIGYYYNEEFIELNNLINESIDPKTRKTGLPIENYYTYDDPIVTGITISQLNYVQSYNNLNPYIVGLNMAEDPTQNFNGVLEIKTDSIVYVIGGDVDQNGLYISNTGVIYETFEDTREVVDSLTGEIEEVPITTFKYRIGGIKEYNSQLQALLKNENHFGLIGLPRIDNDLDIDRGTVNVFEKHLRLSEIRSFGQLERYNSGFYNVTEF